MDINKVETLIPILLIPKEALEKSKLAPGTAVCITADEGIIRIEKAKEQVDQETVNESITESTETNAEKESEKTAEKPETDSTASEKETIDDTGNKPESDKATETPSENVEEKSEAKDE